MEELDSALSRQAQLSSPLDGELSWHFICVRLGQRHLLDPGVELGRGSFGLTEEFDLSRTETLSHLAMNVFHVDDAFSLFWNSRELMEWCRGEQLTLPSLHCMKTNCFAFYL